MSGYWTPERLAIWHRLTPSERDYDRLIARVYPPGQGSLETAEAREERGRIYENRENDHGCSCHINPPCSHCTDCEECNPEEEL